MTKKYEVGKTKKYGVGRMTGKVNIKAIKKLSYRLK